MISGKAFLVKSKDEVTIYKPIHNSELLEEIKFFDNTLYSAVEGNNCIAVINRNHKSCIFNKQQFNKHFEIKIN